MRKIVATTMAVAIAVSPTTIFATEEKASLEEGKNIVVVGEKSLEVEVKGGEIISVKGEMPKSSDVLKIKDLIITEEDRAKILKFIAIRDYNSAIERAKSKAEDPAHVYGGAYVTDIEGKTTEEIVEITKNLNYEIDRVDNFRIWIYDVADEAKKTGTTSEELTTALEGIDELVKTGSADEIYNRVESIINALVNILANSDDQAKIFEENNKALYDSLKNALPTNYDDIQWYEGKFNEVKEWNEANPEEQKEEKARWGIKAKQMAMLINAGKDKGYSLNKILGMSEEASPDEIKRKVGALLPIIPDGTTAGIVFDDAIGSLGSAIQEVLDNTPGLLEEKDSGGSHSSGGSSSIVVTTVSRISGKDRTGTSVKLSKRAYSSAKTVILAAKDNFADALTASTLASKMKAPILLVDKNNLDKEIKFEIERLCAKEVIIVGGENSVSSNVENKAKELVLRTKRVAGTDRYGTSKAIAKELFDLTGKNERAVIANGQVFADALTVSPFAIEKSMPILLVKRNQVPKATKEALKDVKEVYIAGGENSVNKSVENDVPKVVKRFAGANRYETAVNIAKEAYSSPYTAYVASGQVFADALVVGPIAARDDAPILLAKKKEATKYTLDYLKEKPIRSIKIIGGQASISEEVQKTIDDIR